MHKDFIMVPIQTFALLTPGRQLTMRLNQSRST
jgi:hypothetical protein